MTSMKWRGAMAAGLTVAGLAGWLAGPSGASSQRTGSTRTWHGMHIQSLDPVPSQFQNAHSAAVAAQSPVARAVAAMASAALTSTTSTSSTPALTIPTTTTPTTTTTTPSSTPPPPADVILSNETSFSRWAYTNAIVWIHKLPDANSPHIVKTHWYTEDGFPEIYLALRQHTDSAGHVWVKLRIPRRPNGETGWVPRSALGRLHLTHQEIVVSRTHLRMYLYSKGHKVWSAPVGLGKRSTPTPAGRFWIRERFKINSSKSGYYPYAFGTSDYSTLSDWPGGGLVGIHGPYYNPKGIPGRISHGCIRLEVAADAWLARHITLGVPVHVT